MRPDDDSYFWDQWPVDVPRPTAKEWQAAKERWRAATQMDDSDFACDFHLATHTYSRWCWWEFFFPDDKEGKQRAFDEATAFVRSMKI